MVDATHGMGQRRTFTDIRRFERVSSTNTWLIDRARSGAPEGLVAVADYQEDGRGRLSRRWESPPGSGLLASFLLRPVLQPALFYLATACVALSAAEACGRAAGVPVGIKWPNDLVVPEGKLAGVLSDVDAGAPGGLAGSAAIVVGLGVNILSPSTEPSVAGAAYLDSLLAPGTRIDRDELLEEILDELSMRRTRLDSGSGRRELAAELEDRCVTLGSQVRVELFDDTFFGTATGITSEGALIVSTPKGENVISAGDVVHLRPASEGTEPPP